MFPTFSFWLYLLFTFTFGPKTTHSTLGNHTDHVALLKFKESISKDPFGILVSWNSSTHFCHWHGITCSPKHQRVTELNLTGYDLQGSISNASNMFHTLPNIQRFHIGVNQIYGQVPTSIANTSILEALDISQNHFIGQVPSLGKLQDLWLLNLEFNNLGGNSTKDLEFLTSLTNCSKLQLLSIASNNFGGCLPNSWGNLSTQLSRLYLGVNQLTGKIPAELGNLNSLILLAMEVNHFTGNIPKTFCNFQKMQVLHLGQNKLSGDIPVFIGNLSKLFLLDLQDNMLEGNIPPSIGNCHKLQHLDLSQNNLRGSIPVEVFSLSSLTKLLNLSQNSLSGNLPDEVGRLKNIDCLDVSENHLSGSIPGTIGGCISLEYLYLQGNSFHGIVPSSLTSLKSLQRLDLSRNNLSGSIPTGLQNIEYLEYLNVSFNKLDGEVPKEGVFQNISAFAVSGNKNLCGGISELHLLPCSVKDVKLAKHRKFKLIVVVVSVAAFLLILSLILTIYWMRKRNRKPSFDSTTIDQLAKVSYGDLHRGTDGFSAIGSGSFGSVFRGNIVSEDRVVAIKVLKLQKKGANKSFIAECNTLKNIRHRNLAKILTCCSSTDYKGQEFKALVFEYMNNGSLESWLHPENTDQPKSLNLEQRFNIIVDVASAFHYLHYECEQPVIHCDLKPSNVLLDDCMVAHVSDFGLAKLLPSIIVSRAQSSTLGIKGTIGYAPPEYGMGSEVSIEGDMYSFGILVLEMLTGKRPTDEIFEDGHNLRNYVELSVSDTLLQIVDPIILNGLDQDGNLGIMQLQPNAEKCLVSLFSIGLACSMESPKERMSMVHVTRELNLIKSFFPAVVRLRQIA